MSSSERLADRIISVMKVRIGNLQRREVPNEDSERSIVGINRFFRRQFDSYPTQELLNAKADLECRGQLPQADLTYLAKLAQSGIDAYSNHSVSPTSIIALLQIFESLVDSRPGLRDPEKLLYFGRRLNIGASPSGNLGTDARETLQEIIELDYEYLRGLSGAVPSAVGADIAECLFMLLDEQEHSTQAIAAALDGRWPILWRLAARGHYAWLKKPVREREEENPKLPFMSWMFEEGAYQLGIIRADHELALNLTMNSCSSLGAMYAIGSYQKIAEFRYMLSTMTSTSEPWHGEHFFAYTNPPKRDQLWFRADGGVSFGFTPEEWNSLNVLFDRTFSSPEIAAAWEVLGQEYGEF